MKEYLIEKEEELLYVLHYEICVENDSKVIKIYFANGDIRIIPYSKENEEEILKRMNFQMSRYSELDIKRKFSINHISLFMSLAIALLPFFSSTVTIYGLLLMLSVGVTVSTINIKNIVKYSKI